MIEYIISIDHKCSIISYNNSTMYTNQLDFYQPNVIYTLEDTKGLTFDVKATFPNRQQNIPRYIFFVFHSSQLPYFSAFFEAVSVHDVYDPNAQGSLAESCFACLLQC